LEESWPRKTQKGTKMNLRNQLVTTALEWQKRFGVAPAITSAISEYDAAILVGCPEDEYSDYMQDKTAVSKGCDFVFGGTRYQVKANRPSGKPGSFVTKVGKANNYDWDVLIWIHYTTDFEIQEAWMWNVDDYREQFHLGKHVRPQHMRRGKQLK
jgi:hypothetical protein